MLTLPSEGLWPVNSSLLWSLVSYLSSPQHHHYPCCSTNWFLDRYQFNLDIYLLLFFFSFFSIYVLICQNYIYFKFFYLTLQFDCWPIGSTSNPTVILLINRVNIRTGLCMSYGKYIYITGPHMYHPKAVISLKVKKFQIPSRWIHQRQRYTHLIPPGTNP